MTSHTLAKHVVRVRYSCEALLSRPDDEECPRNLRAALTALAGIDHTDQGTLVTGLRNPPPARWHGQATS